MNYDAPLKKRVDKLSTPIFLRTKAELVDYYQQHHGKAGSKDSWKKAIIKDLAAETGKKEKSLEKRFDKQRLEKVEKKTASQYVDLGKKIGQVGTRPPKGYQIYFVVDIKISGKCGNIRSHTETLTGSAAYDFSQNPSWDTLMMLYFKGSVAENICKVYWDETTITPI